MRLPDGPVLLALHRVGPYHRARFSALARRCDLVVLQTRPHSNEYPWEEQPLLGYRLESLQGAPSADLDPPLASLDDQLDQLICRHRPSALVMVGWVDRSYQRLLILAHRHRLPLVLISDSRHQDHHRSLLGEVPKRLLLRGLSAALVAGNQSRAYLLRLGFPPSAIFQPWDVVDNQAWGSDASALPLIQRLPPHWLCISRFVAKKNHRNLLLAFAAYQRRGGSWGLKLIGEGPLEPRIREWISLLPRPQDVQILPFLQFEALRDQYHQARALILASRSDQWGLVVNEAMAAGLPVLVSQACGCTADLIEDGVNGIVLDPLDPTQMADQFSRVERLTEVQLNRMVEAASATVSLYDLDAFVQGTLQAVNVAQQQPRFSRTAALMAELLSRRC